MKELVYTEDFERPSVTVIKDGIPYSLNMFGVMSNCCRSRVLVTLDGSKMKCLQCGKFCTTWVGHGVEP